MRFPVGGVQVTIFPDPPFISVREHYSHMSLRWFSFLAILTPISLVVYYTVLLSAWDVSCSSIVVLSGSFNSFSKPHMALFYHKYLYVFLRWLIVSAFC